MSAKESETREFLIESVVGERIRGYRITRGWTLDELAARSEVSRRSVINVEQGKANASISLLLRLSTALGVSLADLLETTNDSNVQIRTKETQQILWHGENGGSATLVGSLPAPNVVELWDWKLAPGESYESEAHSVDTAELLHVLQGQIELMVGRETFTIKAGDSAKFKSDVFHSYSNHTTKPARFSLSVFQPGVK